MLAKEKDQLTEQLNIEKIFTNEAEKYAAMTFKQITSEIKEMQAKVELLEKKLLQTFSL